MISQFLAVDDEQNFNPNEEVKEAWVKYFEDLTIKCISSQVCIVPSVKRHRLNTLGKKKKNEVLDRKVAITEGKGSAF